MSYPAPGSSAAADKHAAAAAPATGSYPPATSSYPPAQSYPPQSGASAYPPQPQSYAAAYPPHSSAYPAYGSAYPPTDAYSQHAAYPQPMPAAVSEPELRSTYREPGSSYLGAPGATNSNSGCETCGGPHPTSKCSETTKCRRCGKFGHAMRDCPDLHRVRVAPDETDTIYISGLPTTQPADSKQTLTEQSLIDFFGAIGKIHEAKSKADPRGPKLPKVKLYRTPQGGIKGDATVSYEDPHSAPAAVKWFNDKEFMGAKIKVELSKKIAAPEGGDESGGGAAPSGFGQRGGFGQSRGSFRGRGGGASSFGGSSNRQPGDWDCPNCPGQVNFARRDRCNKCQAPKPGGASGPPGGRSDYESRHGGGSRGGYSGQGSRGDQGGYSRDRPPARERDYPDRPRY